MASFQTALRLASPRFILLAFYTRSSMHLELL